MFTNLGDKIMIFAIFCALLLVLAAVITGIVVIFSDFIFGIIIIAIGVFFAWLFWLFVYGYGHLIDSVDSLSLEIKDIRLNMAKLGDGATAGQKAESVQMAGCEKIPAWKRVELEKQNRENQ